VYLVPRQNGRIVIGATSEEIGFTPHNTPAGVQYLLNAALRLYPALQNWTFEGSWWGFRPSTPDELPVLGPSPYINLTLATGHYRNGILLMPITAKLITEWIFNRPPNLILQPFYWNRALGRESISNTPQITG
jgi:thiazole synthase